MKLNLLIFLLALPFLSLAQTPGIVIDIDTQLPLENVIIQSNDTILISDSKGVFYIDASQKTLNASLLGYSTKNIEISDSTKQISIYLEPKVQLLNEFKISLNPFHNTLKNTTGGTFLLPTTELDRTLSYPATELLNRIPGVFVHQGTQNTNRITIRGIGARSAYSTNRIKAYWGDIPLTSGDGTTLIEDIDLSAIGKIEVLKGPSSAIFGSGLGGVIRLSPYYHKENSVLIHSSLGSFNTVKKGINLGFKKGITSHNFQYSNHQSDGYRQNNRYNKHVAILNSNRHTINDHFSLNILFTNLNAQIPSSLSYYDFINTPQSAAANWHNVNGFEDYTKILAGITHQRQIRDEIDVQTSIFAGRNKQYESRPFDILQDRSLTAGIRQTLKYNSHTLKTAIGYEYFNEHYRYQLFQTNNGSQGNKKNGNKELRQYGNIYIHNSYKPNERLTATSSFNINLLSYKLTDEFDGDEDNISGTFTYSPIFSPRLGISYQLAKNAFINANIGHGFSHPSLDETLQPEGQLNTSLKPEQGYNLEIGGRVLLWLEKTQIEWTLYRIYLNDLLTIKRDTEDLFYAINSGKTQHQGFELNLLQEILNNPQSIHINYKGTLSLSDQQFEKFVENGVSYSDNQLPGIPSFAMNHHINISYHPFIQSSILWQKYGSQYLNDANTERIKGYSLFGIKMAAHILHHKHGDLSLFTSFSNILNVHYAAMILINAPAFGDQEPRYFYPGNPRSFIFGLKLKFNGL